MRKPTTYITLTSTEPYGVADGLIAMSERLHVWGTGHDIANVPLEARCIAVYPVQEASREDCPIGMGAIKTARRPATPTILVFDQIVSLSPGPDIEEVEAGAA